MMRMMKTVIMYVILLALVMLNWIAIAKAKPEEGDRSGGGRKYNLDVALYGMTNASGRHRWRTSAEREKVTLALTNFAYCVYEMTDGCHRLGTITVYELGKGEPLPKANCDIIWEKQLTYNGNARGDVPGWTSIRTSQMRAAIYVADYSTKGTPNIDKPMKFGAILAHEWGHAEYGFGEEYDGTYTQFKDGGNGLIMGNIWTGKDNPGFDMLNLSIPADVAEAESDRAKYFVATDSTQYKCWEQSCWERLIAPNDRSAEIIIKEPTPGKYVRIKPPYFLKFDEFKDHNECARVDLPKEKSAALKDFKIVWKKGCQKNKCMFVDDASGSMSDTDWANASSQVQLLVQSVPEGTVVGFMTFSDRDKIETVVPLTEVTETNRSAIKEKIAAARKSNGNTALWEAAWQALDAIETYSAEDDSENVNAGIILLTDGDDNDSTKTRNEVVARCKDMGVSFNSVAYGSNAESSLPSVSEETGGSYHSSGKDATEVGQAFLRSFAASFGKTTLADYTYQLTKPTQITRSFFVDSSLTNLVASVGVATADEDDLVRLVSPSGSSISGERQQSEEGSATIFHVAAPECGEWTLEAAIIKPSRVTLYADANLLEFDMSFETTVCTGDGFLTVTLRDEHAIMGAEVVATVSGNGYSREITLDNGDYLGDYKVPLVNLGPDIVVNGVTLTATLRKSESYIDLDDGLVCDIEVSGTRQLTASKTRVRYISAEEIIAGLVGFSFPGECGYVKDIVTRLEQGVITIDWTLKSWQPGLSVMAIVSGRDTRNNISVNAVSIIGDGVTSPAKEGENRLCWDIGSDYPDYQEGSFDVSISILPLLIPASVTATQGDEDGVFISWRGNAAQYEIWRGPGDDVSLASKIDVVTGNSYADNTAVPGISYWYWVRPLFCGNVGEFGISAYGYRAVPAPTDVSASTMYTDYVLVKWLPIADAKSYRVYRSASWPYSQEADLIAEVVYSPPGNSGAHIGLYYVEYQDRTAEVGAGYYYWIKSVGESATSDFSEVVYGGRKPMPPTGVSATDGTYSGGVVVTWRPAEGATRYNVYSSTDDSSFCARFIGSTDRCAFYDTSASGGEIYHYWVEACTPAAYSDYSESDTGWRRATISGNAPYVVIDLSQGPTAERFPCYEMWWMPGGTNFWPREYKTDKLVLRRIDPGSFTMGSPKNEVGRINSTESGSEIVETGRIDADEDQHEVTIGGPYYIGVFEVTCKQWANIGAAYAPVYGNGLEAYPAYNVMYVSAWGSSIAGCVPGSLIGKLRQKVGLGNAFDLPTEAQWEYACRAGTTTAINNGSNLVRADAEADANMNNVARYLGNGGKNGTAEVGSYAPNSFGLYDMHGNVAEWCQERFMVDRWGCARLRGGSHDDKARNCRSASRVTLKQDGVLNFNDSGMRVVLNVKDIVNGNGADDPVWFVDNGELVVYEPNGAKNVVISDGVTSIGEMAFCECSDLVSVKMPNSVTNIGESAFEGCQNLKTLSLSTSLREIGKYAFCGCSSLQTVTIPKTVETIGAHAFCDCESLAKITVDNGNVSFKSIDGILYTKDGKKLICCPGGKTGSVTIPEGVKRIEECAFGSCDKLKSVTLPKSLESVGSRAFAYSLCDDATIPGVLLVDGWAVESYRLSGELDLKGVKGIADYCFEYTDITAVTIHEGVKRIPVGAFDSCENLSRVSIPDSVEYVEHGGFYTCYALLDYESIPGVALVDGWVVNSTSTVSGELDLSAARGIANGAFVFAGSDLTGVILPKGLKHIGEMTFACCALESISIPDGVVSIDAEAFDCSSLCSLTIPKSVKEIGDYAFGCCLSLTNIVFEGDAPNLVGDAFSGCDTRTTVYVPYGSVGWGVTIPGIWNRMKISYIGETPDMIRCNVTFDANGGKPAKQTIEQIATVAWSTTSLHVPTKSDCVFDGWWTATTGGERVDLEGICGLSGDTTLYARWLKAYNATVKDGSVYTDDIGPAATVSAINGTRLYLDAADKSDNNMEFAYWSYTPATADLGEGFDPREPHAECDMPEANVTFTANYVAKPGYVRVFAHEVNGTANADGDPEGIEWSADGKFWLAANDDRAFPVKTGKTTFKFRSADPRWTVPASATYVIDSNSAFSDIDIAATRVAIVEADSLSEQSGASGTVTLNPKNGQVLPGKPVTLTAKPGKDTVFAYWLVNDEKVGYTATFKYAPDADCTVTAVFRLKSTVENPALDVDAVVPSVNTMVGVAFEASVPLDDAAYPAKFTAKGLPAGLKIDAASGVISGVPTKAGNYAVTIATAGGANGKANSSITLPITINPLPGWAQGTFTGHVSENGTEYGLASLTVSGAGKVSGKIALNGTNWTFAAASYDAISRTDEEDGFDTCFAVVAEAKAGKTVFPLSFSVWKAAAPDGDGAGLLNSSAFGSETWGENVVNVSFFRNIWKDKATADAAKVELAKREGVYTLSLASDLCGEFGSGYLSLTVGKDGNVKAAGKLADGTSISATSPLMYNADYGYFAYFHAAPSAYKGGVFALTVSFDEALGALGNTPGIVQWNSRNPQATGEYGEGFSRRGTFTGAYYDKLAKLNEYYDSLRFSVDGTPLLSYTYKKTYINDSNKKVTATETREVEAIDLSEQDGLSVAVDEKGALVVAKATKPVQDKDTKEWSYGGDNDGALTLSFAQATGIFKGSYTFWYDYMSANDETTDKKTYAHTSKKVTFEGIGVRGNDNMSGFYLWDASGSYLDEKTKKEKSYKYKMSFPVSLLSE